jgi:hypothetical protein
LKVHCREFGRFGERKLGWRHEKWTGSAVPATSLGPTTSADTEHLVAAWHARQEAHMPVLCSSTIGAAIAGRHWFPEAPPGVPDHDVGRSTHDRSSPRRGDHKPHRVAILPILPAECAVC